MSYFFEKILDLTSTQKERFFMSELWKEIEDFPDYSVSTYGRVFSGFTSKMMTYSLLQNGIPTVGLMRDNTQHRRAIAPIVAKAWVHNENWELFDTPIHLDGDRQNCYADNLLWRPRWFAVQYHKEQATMVFPGWRCAFMNLDTGEVFYHPRECARKYGILEIDIQRSILNSTYVFPISQRFQAAPEYTKSQLRHAL